jgi:hypothetical protein
LFPFEHHALVDIQAGSGDLIHQWTRLASVDEMQLAGGFVDSHVLAVRPANGAIVVVDEPDVVRRCRYIGH